MGPKEDPKEWAGSLGTSTSSGYSFWEYYCLFTSLLTGTKSIFTTLSTISSCSWLCTKHLLVGWCWLMIGLDCTIGTFSGGRLTNPNPFFKSLLKWSCLTISSWFSSFCSVSKVSQYGRPVQSLLCESPLSSAKGWAGSAFWLATVSREIVFLPIPHELFKLEVDCLSDSLSSISWMRWRSSSMKSGLYLGYSLSIQASTSTNPSE